LLALTLLAAAACSDASSDDDPDADPILPGADASVEPDADEVPDADLPDAAALPDAAVAKDGGGTGDGGTDELCAALCAFIFDCFGVPPDPACESGCITDTADCTAEELAALAKCKEGDCELLEACVSAVKCVEGGGGGCGDGSCSEEETCASCPADCGACVCGDGLCTAGETCVACPADCGECVCGDGVCGAGECATCEADCPGGCACPHDMCVTGEKLDPTCEPCVVMVCAADSYCCDTYWDGLCVSEVTSICGKDCPTVCGDGICAGSESSMTCPEDCGPVPEFCGDSACSASENCATCPADCGACVCGDGTCSPGECATCTADCPAGCICPHEVCTTGDALDTGCSTCVKDICAVDPYCCASYWDSLCVSEAETVCGKDCPDVCGDGICSPSETCETCMLDCCGVPPPPEPTPSDGGPGADAGP
jgi:hypothetical protein